MNIISEYLSFVAVVILSVRCAIAWPYVTWPESIGLALVLAIHYGKKWFEQKNENGFSGASEFTPQLDQIKEDIILLSNKISGINLQLGIKNIGSERNEV